MSSKTVRQNIIALFKIFPIMFSSKSHVVQHVISPTPALPAVHIFIVMHNTKLPIHLTSYKCRRRLAQETDLSKTGC